MGKDGGKLRWPIVANSCATPGPSVRVNRYWVLRNRIFGTSFGGFSEFVCVVFFSFGRIFSSVVEVGKLNQEEIFQEVGVVWSIQVDEEVELWTLV